MFDVEAAVHEGWSEDGVWHAAFSNEFLSNSFSIGVIVRSYADDDGTAEVDEVFDVVFFACLKYVLHGSNVIVNVGLLCRCADLCVQLDNNIRIFENFVGKVLGKVDASSSNFRKKFFCKYEVSLIFVEGINKVFFTVKEREQIHADETCCSGDNDFFHENARMTVEREGI